MVTILAKRFSYAILSLIMFAGAGYAQNHPASSFRNLSANELTALTAGQTVFRQPDNWKGLSLPAAASFYKDIEDTIRKGGHNYIGEVLLVLPDKEAEALLPALKARLLDFEGYAGIPYWSRRNKKYYDLFDWVKVVKGSAPGSRPPSASLDTLQFMEPFGEYGSRYAWDFSASALSFSGENTSHLSYDGFKAVSPGNLIWRLGAYRANGYWVFYGLGAVKAFDMFGALRERLSASFMGRIEAFFKHVYSAQ
jgi:hypothetical protein